MTNEKTKLVTLGDSIGTNYKLKVRSNTFSDLLGRRLGLEVCNHASPAATSGILLNLLQSDDNIIREIKDAKIVLITAGSNDLIRKSFQLIAEAAGLELTMRIVNEMVDKIKKNPLVTLKMIAAMNSKKMKDTLKQSIEDYKSNMALMIDRIKELNDEAVIMVATLYTLSDVGRSIKYKAFSKPTLRYMDPMNDFIRNELPAKGVLVLDLAKDFREYDGNEELSNLKENDFHLSDQGHLLAYRKFYDRLIADHPEMACEEGADVIQKRKLRKTWKKEDGAYGRSKFSPIVREIVEKTSYEEIKDYDEDKQFVQMGVSPTEVYDIGREIEKEVLKNSAEIPLPYTAYIRPTYFVDYLEGKLKPSILERLDTLPHYASAEEKAEAEKADPETLKKIKDIIYGFLNDDMVIINRDSSILGTLDMDYFMWGSIMNRIITTFNDPLDFAMTPDPEKVTVGEIADGLDKGKNK